MIALIKLIRGLIKSPILSNLSFSTKIGSQTYNFTRIKSLRLPIYVVLTQISIFLHWFHLFGEFMLSKIGLR